MLKERHQGDRKEALTKLNLELEDRFRKWRENEDNLGYISSLPKRLKDERELLKICKVVNQFAELKRNLSREIDTINNLMQQDERSSKVKSTFQKLQETKTKLDRTYENACGLLQAESVGSLPLFENYVKEFSLKTQQATTDSLNYVDRSNEEKNHWNLPMTSDEVEENNSRKDTPVTSNDDEDGQTQSWKRVWSCLETWTNRPFSSKMRILRKLLLENQDQWLWVQ